MAIIYQEFNLLPERTVAENVWVGREPGRFGVVDRGRMLADTQRLLDELGERSFGPRTLVRTLSVAQQQVVEVVKARSLDARIVVMDEPTAALADDEAEALLALVRRLREQGIAVLYISHRLREVFAVADRITVLKDGRRVDTVAAADTTPGRLVTMMVGRELDAYYPERAVPDDIGDVRLAVRGGGNAVLADIDLEVRAGEIVGIGGLQGAGRTELVRALFGADPFTEGTVEVDGRPRRLRSPRAGDRRRPRLPHRGPQGRRPRPRAVGARQHAAGPAVGRGPRAPAYAARPTSRAWRRPPICGPRASSRRRGSCRAATSRRWCWPSGWRSSPGCCCSTSRPAASTSAPRPPSTISCASSPAKAAPS